MTRKEYHQRLIEMADELIAFCKKWDIELYSYDDCELLMEPCPKEIEKDMWGYIIKFGFPRVDAWKFGYLEFPTEESIKETIKELERYTEGFSGYNERIKLVKYLEMQER